MEHSSSLTGCLECVMERIYPRSATPARPGARIHPPGLWAYRLAPKVHGLVFEFARRWDTPLLFFLGKSPIDQCDILRVVPIKVSFVRSSASRNSPSANLTGKGYLAHSLAGTETSEQGMNGRFALSGSVLMLIEFAPLLFGTAASLAVLLFFSVAEH
jgi:hypothetical protein